MSEEAVQGQGGLLLSNSRFAGDEADIGGGDVGDVGDESSLSGRACSRSCEMSASRPESETRRRNSGQVQRRRKGPAPLRLIRGLLCWQAHCVPARFPFLNTVTSAIHGAPFRDMHLAGREGTGTLLIVLIVRSPPLQLLQARHLVVRHGVASC